MKRRTSIDLLVARQLYQGADHLPKAGAAPVYELDCTGRHALDARLLCLESEARRLSVYTRHTFRRNPVLATM